MLSDDQFHRMKNNQAVAARDTGGQLDIDSFREFTVQETAEMTGLSEHTLRYYERIGLLAPVKRDSGSRHRRYTAIDLARIEALACLRAVGMPIEDMRRYSELSFEDPRNADELLRILEKQRSVLEERRAQIEETIGYVELKIVYLKAVSSGDERKAGNALKKMLKKLDSIAARAGG
jgi:DNA-binding transcriptional MerR regulator